MLRDLWSAGGVRVPDRVSAEGSAGDRRSNIQRYRILLQEWPLRRLDEDRNVAFALFEAEPKHQREGLLSNAGADA